MTRPPWSTRRPSGLSVAISWEIFFGDRVREGVAEGAGVVLNPTNGSSFTGTLVQTQQVASSRMRAIESDRWLAQVAPTGFSAVIDPDGTVQQRSAVSEQTVLHQTIGVREGMTPYTRWGRGRPSPWRWRAWRWAGSSPGRGGSPPPGRTQRVRADRGDVRGRGGDVRGRR